MSAIDTLGTELLATGWKAQSLGFGSASWTLGDDDGVYEVAILVHANSARGVTARIEHRESLGSGGDDWVRTTVVADIGPESGALIQTARSEAEIAAAIRNFVRLVEFVPPAVPEVTA